MSHVKLRTDLKTLVDQAKKDIKTALVHLEHASGMATTGVSIFRLSDEAGPMVHIHLVYVDDKERKNHGQT